MNEEFDIIAYINAVVAKQREEEQALLDVYTPKVEEPKRTSSYSLNVLDDLDAMFEGEDIEDYMFGPEE